MTKKLLRSWRRSSQTIASIERLLRTDIPSDLASIWRHSRRAAQIRAYLAGNRVGKLHLGAGKTELDGWLNSDLCPSNPNIIKLDARLPLPFAERTFEYVFSEHFIEHITYPEAQDLLMECLRILCPGGKIRLATPDLERLLRLLGAVPGSEEGLILESYRVKFSPQLKSPNAAFVINDGFRNWGHQFLYDRRTLLELLTQVGFTDAKVVTQRASDDLHLDNLERHGDVIGDWDLDRYFTFCVEARRPSDLGSLPYAGTAAIR